MKHIATLLRIAAVLCIISLSYPCQADKDEISQVLMQLDSALEVKQDYLQRRVDQLEQLKTIWRSSHGQTRFDLASEIFFLYNGLNTDSAYAYAVYAAQIADQLQNKELIQRAKIYEAQCLSINCMFELADAILEPMESQLYPSNQLLYYKALSSFYNWEPQFSTLAEKREEDWALASLCRQQIIRFEKDPIWRAQEEAILSAEREGPERAIQYLMPVFLSLSASDDQVRYLANSLGSFHARLDHQDSALYYYALSAISDIQHGVMEHASLREVALILFKRGDIARAYRYMQCCIEDAEYCKARLRTIEMAGDMPVILNAYQSTIKEQQRSLHIVNSLLIVGIIVLCLVVFWVVRSRHSLAVVKETLTQASEQLRVANNQLKESNLQLEASNQSLLDSNRIRSAYVTQYMKECSEAIEKLGIYHKQLLRIANSSNYETLFSAVKSTDFIDENLRDFYMHFDDTFLSLFPHFVEDFNKLLRPDAAFTLPSNNKLSTELRIFALIRLGITNSEDIARFLRLSEKTVYNYRAAVRNRASDNRDILESQVCQIGL